MTTAYVEWLFIETLSSSRLKVKVEGHRHLKVSNWKNFLGYAITRRKAHSSPVALSFQAYNLPFLQILPTVLTVAFISSSGLAPQIPWTVYRYF